MNYIARELVLTLFVLLPQWRRQHVEAGVNISDLAGRNAFLYWYTLLHPSWYWREAWVFHSFSAPKTLIVIHMWNMVGIVTRLPYQKEAGCTDTTLINSHLVLAVLIASMYLESSLTCRTFGWSHLDYLLHQPTLSSLSKQLVLGFMQAFFHFLISLWIHLISSL